MEDRLTEGTQIAWDKMTKEQQSKIASRMASVGIWKFFCLSLVAVILAGQPLWSAYYKDQDAARKTEILKSEKQSESALELAKAAISEVTLLSSRQGELKAENEQLRKQALELKNDLSTLNTKYKEMEAAYLLAIEEKKKLESRIDTLFKQKENAPTN